MTNYMGDIEFLDENNVMVPYGEKYHLGMWASRQDLSGSDEAVKAKIARQFGFAEDEKIHPSKVFRDPDFLVKGQNYALASNGYPVGKYLGYQNGLCSFENACYDGGWLWNEIGLYKTE